jgi:two-component system, OmpR family, phosphate regulon response regulator PhoB
VCYLVKSTILVVEDELPIRGMLVFALQRNGYETLEASDTNEAWVHLRSASISMILLDWMLPGVTGVEFLSQVKALPTYKDIPVIMLTARAEERNKLRGFDVGADDYVTKPFSPKELLARINVHLKRSIKTSDLESSMEKESVSSGGIELNVAAHELYINGEEVKVRPLEFKLLRFFMENPNKVHSRTSLLMNIWGLEKDVSERTVDVHIRRLRELLTPSGYSRYFSSVRSAGYKFVVGK